MIKLHAPVSYISTHPCRLRSVFLPTARYSKCCLPYWFFNTLYVLGWSVCVRLHCCWYNAELLQLFAVYLPSLYLNVIYDYPALNRRNKIYFAHIFKCLHVTETSIRNLTGVKHGWFLRLLTTIYDPIVYKIWDCRCFTNIWASMACYRHNFTSLN
jgi:hypothetical protein